MTRWQIFGATLIAAPLLFTIYADIARNGIGHAATWLAVVVGLCAWIAFSTMLLVGALP